MFSQLYSEAQRSGDMLQQAWARGGQGETSLRLGHLEEACAFLEDANRLLAENAEVPSQISNYGLLAMVRLRQGDQQQALAAAQAAVRLLANIPVPTAYYLIEGYAGFAETYLALWQASSGQTPEQRRILARQARQACDALAHFARTFPIGRPRSLLWQGLYAWLAGKPARAHQTWRKGLSVAQQMAMPYEEALLQYEIGRHISGAQRLDHLQSAHTLFGRLGAALDCARVEKLLAAAQPPPGK
jgi:tetratricopeptide (TPR) repeat protein